MGNKVNEKTIQSYTKAERLDKEEEKDEKNVLELIIF